MALKPKDVYGDALTPEDILILNAYECEIDKALKKARYNQQCENSDSDVPLEIHLPERVDIPEIRNFLGSPTLFVRERMSLPKRLYPALEGQYIQAGWNASLEAREIIEKPSPVLKQEEIATSTTDSLTRAELTKLYFRGYTNKRIAELSIERAREILGPPRSSPRLAEQCEVSAQRCPVLVLVLQQRLLRILNPSPPRTEQFESAIDESVSNGRGGHVYLLQAENGLYKIGRSSSPKIRISAITKAVAPFEIKTIHTAWYPDYYAAETELHKRFAHLRKRGEWFALSPEDVMAVIAHAHQAA